VITSTPRALDAQLQSAQKFCWGNGGGWGFGVGGSSAYLLAVTPTAYSG